MVNESETVSFEYAVLSPLVILYSSNKNFDVQVGALKILLHVLEVLTVPHMSSIGYIIQYTSYSYCFRDMEKSCPIAGPAFFIC